MYVLVPGRLHFIAAVDEQNMAGAQKGGALEYVVKPFDYDVLVEKIAHTLKSKHK